MEEQQFEKCLEELRGAIFAQCLRMLGNREDALEATQDTFKKAWRNRRGYTHAPETPFENWVRRIARNTCHDKLRALLNRPLLYSEVNIVETPDPTPPSNALDELFAKEIMASLQECLDERDFWMFKLKLAQLTLNEIVAELPEPWKLTYEGVKSRFDRQIKRCLEAAKKKYEQRP